MAPSGLTTYVTGPGGIIADLITAFGGIDGILLCVALGVVFLILLIVYRSPILPFAVLVTAVFGLVLAALAIYPAGRERVISLSGQSQGILSILVVGAATDYSLLLVSRYKEELHDNEVDVGGDETGLARAVEPIAASAAHGDPRAALPAAVGPRQHAGARTGGRLRHRGRVHRRR